MDKPTIDIYEERADEWHARRAPRARTDHAKSFAATVRRADRNAVIIDLGCGPGWFSSDLGPGPVLALDGARAMLELVSGYAPGAWRVQADLAALPFRRDALARRGPRSPTCTSLAATYLWRSPICIGLSRSTRWLS